MADMIVLILIASYCLYVIIQYYRKKKNGTQNGCNGIKVGEKWTEKSGFSALEILLALKFLAHIHFFGVYCFT